MIRIGGMTSTVAARMGRSTKVSPYTVGQAQRHGNPDVYLPTYPGKLELMTWEWTNHDIGCRVGWGNSLLEDAAETRRRFEVDCRGKKSLFYKHARRLRPPRWWEQAVHFCQ